MQSQRKAVKELQGTKNSTNESLSRPSAITALFGPAGTFFLVGFMPIGAEPSDWAGFGASLGVALGVGLLRAAAALGGRAVGSSTMGVRVAVPARRGRLGGQDGIAAAGGFSTLVPDCKVRVLGMLVGLPVGSLARCFDRRVLVEPVTGDGGEGIRFLTTALPKQMGEAAAQFNLGRHKQHLQCD